MFAYIVYIYGWFEGCGIDISNPAFLTFREAEAFVAAHPEFDCEIVGEYCS